MDKEQKLRRDLNDLVVRKSFLYDENRSDAVESRHELGRRTARENISHLCDDDFLEIGSLIVAGQRGRRDLQQLIEQTPADGLVCGLGSVNKSIFGEEGSKCYVLSYDYTVLAGTQGGFNHKKTDRILAMARHSKTPVVFFVEGGGGRPGDVDFDVISSGGLDISTFVEYARLSGKVARIAIVAGYCFAGNAAIAGCSDVIIATKDSNLGMGGPAMIEGGGLGRFSAKAIGPSNEQNSNGVIDILVEDEEEAVEMAKKYLSYFQGNISQWSSFDQAALRTSIPENRKFAYDVNKVIELIADKESFLELRSGFAGNIITGLMRIEGKPIGVIANSTKVLGGAIDSYASDKAARFMQLCDAFGLPILSLCDAPGFMVGPDCEKSAMVRHASRMFVVGASLRVPILTVVLRKAYGLGAMAMAGGSLHESYFTVSWPTGEFGAMGLEGAVKLGYRKELEKQESVIDKQNLYESYVREAYERGKALNAARTLEFDEVIDPIDTRPWILAALHSFSHTNLSSEGGRYIDSW